MKDINLQNVTERLLNSQIIRRPEPEKTGESFSETLENAISQVSKLHKAAEKASVDLAVGKAEDIHKTMIALEKADVSLQLMMQIRNKIVSAYEEIMRMQL